MQAIAAIIGAIVVIYLYFLLVQWLFIAVGPIIIIAGSIIGTGAIPVIYGLQLFRIFDKPTWRRIFWTPVFALLALIYVDLVYIVVNVLAAIVRVPAIAATEVAIRPILALTGNTPTVIGFTSIFGPAPNWWVYILLGTLVKGVAIVALALIIRGLENTVKDTRQPAYRQYLFGQATADLGKVVEETPKMFVDIISKAGMWIYEVSYGPQAIALWPISLTAYAAFVPPAIVGIVSFAILMTTHLIGIGIVWALNLYVSALLFCTERAVVLARSGYAKCPHAGCHEPVPLPLFYCPNCGAEHSKLIPGICGIFYRACSCGTSLPTTFWLGKGKLRSACASCRRPLHQQLFRDSAHVPIYGAASSGKTMFMMAATWQMVEGHLDKVQADFINDSDRDSYNKIWKPGFESGRVREKTQQMLPDAFLLSIRRGPGLSLSLYMYDPAGEAIERDSDIEGHRFLRYFDGLALLIDPFSLPHFARRYLEAGHSSLPPSTAQSDPIEVVHRIVNVLESQAGLLRDRQFQRRIAIIFTKADSAFFQQEFGLALDRAEPPRRWSEAGNDVDRRVRAWLRQNEPGLLQALEVRFASLRFFVASALGHESAGGGAFEPKGTLDPLCWLLSARTTLSKPLLALVAGRGAEIAAASAVFLLFVLPGYFGTYYGSGALRLLHPGGQPIPQSSGAVAPVPPSVTFLMRSNLPHPVMLGFFSQTNRARAWEGGVLSASASESYKLSCESGEKICYGAWVDSGDLLGPYWGVGRGGKQSCSHCCLTCPGIGTTIVLESD